jgi:hypothetical protein
LMPFLVSSTMRNPGARRVYDIAHRIIARTRMMMKIGKAASPVNGEPILLLPSSDVGLATTVVRDRTYHPAHIHAWPHTIRVVRINLGGGRGRSVDDLEGAVSDLVAGSCHVGVFCETAVSFASRSIECCTRRPTVNSSGVMAIKATVTAMNT